MSQAIEYFPGDPSGPEVYERFVGKIVADLGGAFGLGLVRIGDELGLYQALHAKGPITSADLAFETGLAERYVREWLAYNVTSDYVAYDAATRTYRLRPEQHAVFADEDHPCYMMSAFDAAAGYIANQDNVRKAFQTGDGIGWSAQSSCVVCAIAGFFRPGYAANLVDEWLPALDGVVEKLESGARVADVGCGHGHSTVLMARAFPRSEFIGFDFHDASIDAARKHAQRHHLGNVRFETATAKSFPGRDFDFITVFDALHDMGDPAGAAKHIREALKPDGTWLIVEPFANDALEDNINPVSRLYYAASTQICVPTSLDQEVGAALGAQAGEKRIREVVVDGGGFTRFRRAAETPVNLILEARP